MARGNIGTSTLNLCAGGTPPATTATEEWTQPATATVSFDVS